MNQRAYYFIICWPNLELLVIKLKKIFDHYFTLNLIVCMFRLKLWISRSVLMDVSL